MTQPTASARAAGSTDNITAAQLEVLRANLTAELEAQRVHAEEHRTVAEQLTGATEGDLVLERELAERALARSTETIAAVEDALARIEAGAYGTCERCGGNIALARLEAIPHTRRCVTCS